IGDVNPGGQVRATGSMYILGDLYGIDHAGIYGDVQTTIAASYMNPAQLRIGNYMSRATDYETEGTYMECAYLDEENDKIVIDRLQVLPYIRNKLWKKEGGMLKMGKAIVVTSGKGGVGKTTTTANLGTALA